MTTPHDARAGAPVFVEVEAVGFYVVAERARECVKGAVEAEHWGDEVEERGLVRDVCVAEEACACDVALAAVRFDATPVVSAL